MMFKNRKIIPPTPEEDEAINAGIAADPDTFVPTDEQFAEMRPRSERVAARRMGQPLNESSNEQISVPCDADIIAAFRATGEGWQARMSDALRIYLREHPIDG
jgi:uncharacterized protein (DUF4415 family)